MQPGNWALPSRRLSPQTLSTGAPGPTATQGSVDPQEQYPEGLWGLKECSYTRWPWQGRWPAGTGCSHPKSLDRTTGSKQCLSGALPKAKTPSISIKLYVLPGPKNNRVGSRRRKRQSPGCTMLDPRAMGICTPAVYRAQLLSCWAACTPGPARGSWSSGAGSSKVEALQQLWNQTCCTWLLEKARFLRCC